MRLALAAILALAPLAASAAPAAQTPPAQGDSADSAARVPQLSADRMNLFAQPGHCRSFDAQIAEANKRLDGTRLDREPTGHAFLAVDRHVGACHQVTFAGDREARSAGR